MARIRHRNLSKSVQGSANKYGTAPTVGRNSFALRLFSIRDVPSKTDARANVVAAIFAWILKKELLVSNGSELDVFGWSVALDGNRALVGAIGRNGPGGDTQGAAYIYDYDGNNWTETADISLGTDGSANDQFGYSVALDGNRALVGAPFRGGNEQGAAYIFDYDGINWSLTTDISLGNAGVADDFFGWSVALDGNRALVGAIGRDGGGFQGKGAAYIFDTNDGINWNPTTDISLGNAGSSEDIFGNSVALDGSRALVGANGRDGGKGAAYIFDLSGTTWGEPTDISLGPVGSGGDQFGYSVALDGTRALSGVPGRTGPGGDNQGAAYIFDTIDGTTWSEPNEISLGTNGSGGDQFGISVALDGNRALVGANGHDGPGDSNQGAAYIFDTNDGTTWSEPKEISLGNTGVENDQFGISVALDGDRALVGASGRDGIKGAAYIYDYERTN